MTTSVACWGPTAARQTRSIAFTGIGPGGGELQTSSIDHAVAAARFFGPRLGPEVVALRRRVVDRCFAAEEGQPDELMKTLDQNVTVVDPRRAEASFTRDFKDAHTMEDAERAATACLQRKLASNEDVPMVEDFPLAPEEETPEFRDLATALGFPFVRAVEHWKGNTDSTLTAIIVRVVEDACGVVRSRRSSSGSRPLRARTDDEPILSGYEGWWQITDAPRVNDGVDDLSPTVISLTGHADRPRMTACSQPYGRHEMPCPCCACMNASAHEQLTFKSSEASLHP
jgi:hypothetical protein